MKQISIAFCDFWPGFNTKQNIFIDILNNYYDVNIVKNNPDFLFHSCFGTKHVMYDCVKIVYLGENLTPDFNLSDYACGFDYIEFDDRYYRLPYYRLQLRKDDLMSYSAEFFSSESKNKKLFCNFIYSNRNRAHPQREIFFDLLSGYKHVDSGGGFRNNIGYRVENKREWQRNYKFTIAFENSLKSGYTTEKLLDALCAHTVPIYWGNPEVGRDFNTKRFINVHEYGSLEEVVNRVRELDNDPAQYLDMLSEPWFIDEPPLVLKEDPSFVSFLQHIVDQGPEKSRRVVHDGFTRGYIQEKQICYYFRPMLIVGRKIKNVLTRL